MRDEDGKPINVPQLANIYIIENMAIPIISTKLHLPTPPRFLVPRPRLTTKLDSGILGKLVLVSAPAGFGKTSLIAEWVNQYSGKNLVSWLHLDVNDNDLIRFLSYLIASLQAHQDDIGEAALSGLGSVPPVPIEAALTSLINDIASIQHDLILILDDYHLLDSGSIHQAVGFLIEHLPEHTCLVLATRTDPPLPLHRLRARGQMTEIRAQELRFSGEETRSLLEGILATPISDSEIAALESRVEGWIAGLQMVALSIQGRQDAHQFLASFSGSHRFIMDYLTEEIYNQQPPHIQEFLLKTSILDRLSGPLCEFILEADGSTRDGQEELPSAQQTLEYLEHANLFLLPMDDERRWYRYHHLFASMLRQRLRQSAPEEIEGLQRLASGWFAANDSLEEAFQYALAANDLQIAAQIVEQHGLDLLKKGTLSTLSGWFGRLPREIILARPRLNVTYAWVLLLSGKAVDFEEYLTAAEENLVNSGDANELRGEIAAIRAYVAAMQEDVERTLEQANIALELLPEDDFSIRGVVSFVLGGMYYLQQDFPKALTAMKEASQSGERSGNIHVAVSALNAAASLLRSQGKIKEAEQTYHQAMKLGTGRNGRPLPIVASTHAGLAEIHLARRELLKAATYARIGVELGEQWTNVDGQIGSYVTLAHVAFLEGNSNESRSALDKAKRIAESHILTPGTQERITYFEELIQEGPASGIDQGTLPEPLSERELEVLRLIAEGRSNPEIATELIIALGTVKAHTSNIYRKLDARRRTQAVMRAKEIGLL